MAILGVALFSNVRFTLFVREFCLMPTFDRSNAVQQLKNNAGSGV